MNKRVRIIIGLVLPIIAITTSCEEEPYKMPELTPVVKFSQTAKKITAENYIASTSSDVEIDLQFMRVEEGKSVKFNLVKASTASETLASAFDLTSASITVVAGELVKQKVGTIDWSKLKPSEKLDVKISIEGDEIFVGPTTSTITLTFEKPQAPLIWLDKSKVYDAIIPKDYSEETMVIPVEIPVTADDVLAPINMPLFLNQYYVTAGVHFNISDPVIRIAAGAKTATLNVEVIKSAFTQGEVKRLWIEMRVAQMPEGTLARIDDSNWWTAIDIGWAN